MTTSIIQDLHTIVKEQLQELVPKGLTRDEVSTSLLPKEWKPEFANIKMLVFDVYGTLLHSRMGEISTTEDVTKQDSLRIPELALSLNIKNTQKELNKYIEAEHRHLRAQNIDFPEVNIVEIWKQYSSDSKEFTRPIHDEEAMICSLRFELAVNPSWGMPTALHTLKTLQERGFALGIISNAQFYTELILETLFAPQWNDLRFEHCVWSYKESVAKPSLELYKTFLSRAQIAPEQILYVGNDAHKDIAPAKKVGMNTVLFAGDTISFRPDAALQEETQPAHFVCSLDEILHFV